MGPSLGPGLMEVVRTSMASHSNSSPLPPMLWKASHEGIRIHQFCEVVLLVLVLQVGKLPRELKTLVPQATQLIIGPTQS